MPTGSTHRGFTNGRMREAPRGAGRTNGMVNGTRGRTNGLVNGVRGRTNGLVNGIGRTNGIVNGNGLVNGSGFVNGLPLRRNPFGIVTRRDVRRGAALVLASLLLVIVVGVLWSEEPPGPPFAADGNFQEWVGQTLYPDDLDAVPPHADLRAYAVHLLGSSLYVYGRTEGPLFSDSNPSSVFVFLNHSRPSSGFPGYRAARDLRVQGLAELFGWDGSLQGVTFRRWAGGPDPDNATAFARLAAVPAAVEGPEFELAVDVEDLGFDSADTIRILVATSAGDASDRGGIIGPDPGALDVTVTPLRVTISANAMVLDLSFRAIGTPVTVTGISTSRSGGGTLQLPDFPFTVAPSATMSKQIWLDPGGATGGDFLTVRVDGVDASVGTRPITPTVTGEAARMYVDFIPGGEAIDGLFNEWSGSSSDPDDPAPMPASIDVLASASSLQVDAFFYARTEGAVLAGSVLPERPTRPVPGGAAPPGPPEPLRRVAGEDVLRIYVDRSEGDAVGQSVAGIVADRLVEIRGRFGDITARKAYAWDPALGDWREYAAAVSAILVGAEIEISVPGAFLGATNNPSVAFAMSDWAGARDATIPEGLRSTRGSGPGPLDGTNAQTVIATALTNIPVVDGDCATSSDEYDGASTDSSTGVFFSVGRRGDFQYVYVCVRATLDTTNNAFDWGELLFDTAHDGQGTPQADDRRFRVNSGSTSMVKEKGDGSVWVDCGTDCDAGDIGQGAFTNGEEVYEFRIRFSDVWGTNSPSMNQEAGFAIVVHDDDAAQDYTWGADNVDDTAPNTWGHLDIPEFGGLAVIAFAASLMPLCRRRGSRRRRTSAANL